MPTPGSEHERESTVHARMHVPLRFHAKDLVALHQVLNWDRHAVQNLIRETSLFVFHSDLKIGLSLDGTFMFILFSFWNEPLL